MNDLPNAACPKTALYIEVLACNTGIGNTNGNASVTLRNCSPHTVTGMTIELSGMDANKIASMIPPVEAISPPVPPGAEFCVFIRIPDRWRSFRAEVSAFRSGDLVFTKDDAAKICRQFDALQPEYTRGIPSGKGEHETALLPRWRNAAVWLTLASAALITLLTCFL